MTLEQPSGWATRLNAVLGSRLRDIQIDDLRELVARQVREDDDLDFKRQLYGNSDRDRRELASDIAALANHRGA